MLLRHRHMPRCEVVGSVFFTVLKGERKKRQQKVCCTTRGSLRRAGRKTAYDTHASAPRIMRVYAAKREILPCRVEIPEVCVRQKGQDKMEVYGGRWCAAG